MTIKGAKVSVVMCTYNGAEYVREQLDSVLGQTYPLHEIIIQDDHSTDGTMKILREYADKYPHVHVFLNEAGKGVNTNFFSAMARTTGDYIAICDQDDIWMKEKIEWQMEAIGDKMLCSGVSEPFPSAGYDRRIPNCSLLRVLFINHQMPGHTMLFPRSLLSKIPELEVPPTIRTYDAIIAMVALAYDSVVYLEKPLVLHRVHAESATFIPMLNYKKSLANMIKHVVGAFKLMLKLRPKVRQYQLRLLDYVLKIDAHTSEYEDAVRMLRMQTSSNPLQFVRLQWFCMKHCDQLFYTRCKKTLFNRMRGWFFPVYLYEYFRYLC